MPESGQNVTETCSKRYDVIKSLFLTEVRHLLLDVTFRDEFHQNITTRKTFHTTPTNKKPHQFILAVSIAKNVEGSVALWEKKEENTKF
jgi:hypothetical protein